MADWLEDLKTRFAAQRPETKAPDQDEQQQGQVRALLFRLTSLQHVPALTVGVAGIAVYFLAGGMVTSTIDDNLAFRPAEADLPPGGSVAVAMSSAVLARELDQHGWSADDPWFYPTLLVDNMPAYQTGIRLTALRFTAALQRSGRRQTPGGAVDPDLADSLTALSYPPDRWWLGADWPWLRAASGYAYDDAVEALREFNHRVANQDAPYERQSDHLAAILRDLMQGLGAPPAEDGRSAREDAQGRWQGLGADEQFHMTRGQAYATYLILSGLREDFGPLIRRRQLATAWADMMLSLEVSLAIDPLVVTQGSAGGMLIKNHLMEQGFALKRVQEQGRAIAAQLDRRA